MMQDAFSATAPTLDISVTATSSTSKALPGQGSKVRIVNEGPYVCWVSIGSGSQTATLPATSSPVATCTPVAVGDCILTIPSDAVYNIAAICRSTQTARLSVQVGEGV